MDESSVDSFVPLVNDIDLRTIQLVKAMPLLSPPSASFASEPCTGLEGRREPTWYRPFTQSRG